MILMQPPSALGPALHRRQDNAAAPAKIAVTCASRTPALEDGPRRGILDADEYLPGKDRDRQLELKVFDNPDMDQTAKAFQYFSAGIARLSG
jgi:hypothetical protein